MKKAFIIYHSADLDGIFSGAIAYNALSDHDRTLCGWDYGQDIPVIPEDVDVVVMLDISIHELMNHPKLTWIDHHRSAIAQYDREDLQGLRVDNVAACKLAWKFFNGGVLPEVIQDKDDFLSSSNPLPNLINYLGAYDVWDVGTEAYDRGAALQFGLGKIKVEDASAILKHHLDDDRWLDQAIVKGGDIRHAINQINTEYAIGHAYTIELEMPDKSIVRLLTLNSSIRSSFAFGDYSSADHDALMVWRFDPSIEAFRISFYGNGSPIDLSVLAKALGGGGHYGASGAQVPTKMAWWLTSVFPSNVPFLAISHNISPDFMSRLRTPKL